MQNLLTKITATIMIFLPQILIAGGSSGTTGQPMLHIGQDQFMLRVVESHEFQDALGAMGSNSTVKIENDVDVWPQDLDIHSGLPLVRSFNATGEEVFLLDRDLLSRRVQPVMGGFALTSEAPNAAAMGGHSGTTGAMEGYLKYTYGIEATIISPESYRFIQDMIEGGVIPNGTVNIENSLQFAPHQVIKVDGLRLIEGMDGLGNYRYLVEDAGN